MRHQGIQSRIYALAGLAVGYHHGFQARQRVLYRHHRIAQLLFEDHRRGVGVCEHVMQCHAALRGVDGNAHRADETDREVYPQKFGAIPHHDRHAITGRDAQSKQAVGGAMNVAQHLLPRKFLVFELEPGFVRMLLHAQSDQLLNRSLCTRHLLPPSRPAKCDRSCYACPWPSPSARMCRAPARLRTSLVPSSISEARASRNNFSIGYSLLSPLPPKIYKASLATSNEACVQKVFAAIACWSEGAPDELFYTAAA